MRKDQRPILERFEAGEDVSGAGFVAATGVGLVVGCVLAVVQWVGCIIVVILAFAIGGFFLGIPALIGVLWWSGKQAARGLRDFRGIPR